MSDDAVRDALMELADEAPPGNGLAETALQRARRRRVRVRATTLGVAGVAVAAVPVGASVLSEFDGSEAVPVGAGESSEPTSTEPAAEPSPAKQESQREDSGVVPAPDSRLLTDDELAEAFASCRADESGEPSIGYDDSWEPVFGITLEIDAEPGTPTTWVAARRGDDYRADCALNQSGEMISAGGEYGAKSTPGLLYAVVDGQEGLGSGRLVDPVASVTVQRADGPEQKTVLHDGFWFYPEIDTVSAELIERDGDEPNWPDAMEDWNLIGVPFEYTFRGYDDAGRLVYDSSVDGPSVEDCYADPTGTEFVGNFAGRSDPAECVRTHEWEPRLEME